MSLRFLTFTFWNYYVLKLLHLESILFSDATLSDINVVLCYVLSQYLNSDQPVIDKKICLEHGINSALSVPLQNIIIK